MKELTKHEMTKKLIGKEYAPISFIYWRHFTFSDILSYCGIYFIPDNKYELDRMFISGEFRMVNNTTSNYSCFALNIEELIAITTEVAEIKWKRIS